MLHCQIVIAIFLLASSVIASDRIVAIVNDVPITELDVERRIELELPNTLYHGNITEERRLRYREKAIEELIIEELFYQEAKAKGIKVQVSEVNEVINSYKAKYGGEEGLKKALKMEELDTEGIKKRIEKRLMVDKFERSYIKDRSRVSDDELKEYYEKNKDNFREPDKVRIREIFISVPYDADYKTIEEKRKKAEDILKRVGAGEDFAELAWRYSEDPYAVKGGDIGYMHKGRLIPELEAVAFRLKPKEVSGLIEVKAGYFIIKVEDFVASRLLGFDEIKDKLRRDLQNKRERELKEDVIKRLKDRAIIKQFK